MIEWKMQMFQFALVSSCQRHLRRNFLTNLKLRTSRRKAEDFVSFLIVSTLSTGHEKEEKKKWNLANSEVHIDFALAFQFV